MIARKLEMKYHFHPAFRWKDEQYGNAILSRYPMALIKSGALPELTDKRHSMSRGGPCGYLLNLRGKRYRSLIPI